MKTLFIEARSDIEISLSRAAISKLPENIALFTTTQHIHKINVVKKQLENAGKKVNLIQGKHSKHKGQILGCDVLHLKLDKKIQAFLYIGTGEFHPKELMLEEEKPVYVFNPESKKFYELSKKSVEPIRKRKKGDYLRFLKSDKIGVLVSQKPGQYNLKQALKLKQKYKNKQFYFLLFDTIELNELENFPFIQCFVNTACPRIAYDDAARLQKPIINIEEVIK